ncbi:MAG: PQQ-binding-like beta-propeller repeat protein [Pirellulales bacterium]
MRLATLLTTCIFTASLSLAGDNWPEFRGPNGDGHGKAKNLPVTFSETENIAWKTEIHGKGWSSPVVWGDQIWMTTATEDGTSLFAVRVDLKSGKVTHNERVFFIKKPQYINPFNSYASPTPAIEEGRVYVHFGAHGTAAIDTATGKVLWKRQDLPCDHFRGPGSSPILFENLLIVNYDGFDLQYVVAFDKNSGDTVWKKDRGIDYGTEDGDFKKAYGTPRLITVNGQPQLINPSAGATISYDPRTGNEIWRVKSGGMNVSARPLWGHGMIYATTAAGGFQLFAVRPEGQGDVTKSHVPWKQPKSIPTRSTPIMVDDLIYMVNDAGIFSCVEAKSGKPVWTQRLGGNYTASPVFADGRLYFFSQEGESPVLEPGRELKLLATNKLDDGCMASPAVADNALLVRTTTHLYRIEK